MVLKQLFCNCNERLNLVVIASVSNASINNVVKIILVGRLGCCSLSVCCETKYADRNKIYCPLHNQFIDQMK